MAALSLYVHFFAGWVILAHALAVAVARPRPRARHLLTAAVIIGVGALPALWFATARDVGQISWISPLSLGGVKGAVEQVSGSNVLLLALTAAGGAILLWRPPPSSQRTTNVLVVAWALVPFACAIAVSVVKPILLGRYLIVAAPALALLGAVTITAIRMRAVAYLRAGGDARDRDVPHRRVVSGSFRRGLA